MEGCAMEQEKYKKSLVKEEEIDEREMFGMKDSEVVVMKVKSGSKVKNLVAFALKTLELPSTESLIWSGHGAGMQKLLACVEIVKQSKKDLHEKILIRYKKIEEVKESEKEGIEPLTVSRKVPFMAILLSKKTIDAS